MDVRSTDRAAVMTLTTGDLEKVFASEVPVLLDFWAPWCRPCRTLEPMLQRLQHRFGSALTVAKVNVDREHDVMARFGVRSIPTLLLAQGGCEMFRFAAAECPETHIVAELERRLCAASV